MRRNTVEHQNERIKLLKLFQEIKNLNFKLQQWDNRGERVLDGLDIGRVEFQVIESNEKDNVMDQ
jgi:hypothetical protein